MPISSRPIDLGPEFYQLHQAELGHYFRTLYHVFKFVDSSGLDKAGKRRYTSLVRAQLSAFELGLLYYNGISPMGREKFYRLIEEFGILKNFEKSLLVNAEHEAFYENAFK